MAHTTKTTTITIEENIRRTIDIDPSRIAHLDLDGPDLDQELFEVFEDLEKECLPSTYEVTEREVTLHENQETIA